jgi:steroid delta-isomerase-like uncharacterized protein
MRRFALVVSVAACALVLVTSGAGDVSSLARAQNATPSAACPVTTEDENEGTARRWFEGAINGADLSVIDEIVTADIVHHAGTFPDGEGSAAVKRILGALLTGFPDARHTIEQVTTRDDVAVVRWQAEGTHEGVFQGFAATGKHVTWTGINIFRFECGKIAESWAEVDGLGRLAQLGLVATPTP